MSLDTDHVQLEERTTQIPMKIIKVANLVKMKLLSDPPSRSDEGCFRAPISFYVSHHLADFLVALLEGVFG